MARTINLHIAAGSSRRLEFLVFVVTAILFLWCAALAFPNAHMRPQWVEAMLGAWCGEKSVHGCGGPGASACAVSTACCLTRAHHR